MSDFLDINGINVPVADGSARQTAPEIIGDVQRANDGTLVKTIRAIKQQYTFSMPPMVQSPDSIAWQGLINGLGHHWGFDSSGLYSGKGLGPASFTGTAGWSSGGKFTGYEQIDAAGNNADYLLFTPTGADAISSLGSFTVLFWARAQDGATWNHYEFVVTNGASAFYKNGSLGSDGVANAVFATGSSLKLEGYGVAQNGGGTLAAWQATHAYGVNSLICPGNGRFYKTNGGTSGSSQPTWPTTLGGTVGDNGMTWTDQGPTALFVDDLVLLPFAVPSSWIYPLYTFCNSQAYPDPPKFQISGLFPRNQNVLAMGEVGEARMIQSTIAGSFASNNQPLDVTIREV